MAGIRADLAVIGGGLGGVAAALAAADAGLRVLLTEQTGWIGGQLTAQGVPPDEHPWIERFGATASYRALRGHLRGYYRHWYPLTSRARRDPALNPGAGRVGPLCVEPKVAHAVLEAMLAAHRAGGRIDLRTGYRPVSVATHGDRVSAVVLLDQASGTELEVQAPFVLDATETGELLTLAGAEYVTGFESRADTGEPNAPTHAQPLNMQAVTWCFAVDHEPGADHTIDRPADYDRWRDFRPPYWPGPMFGLVAPDPHTLTPLARTVVPNPVIDPPGPQRADVDLWTFRRILARTNLEPGVLNSDIVLVNWPMIDYLDGPLFEVDAEQAARHLAGAAAMSRAFLYWLQTELPRPDGGTGLPGLRPRPDVLGTADDPAGGLAMTPYIRESRRIRAEHTVVEQEISLAVRGEHGAVRHTDSVGIGSYRIDLHPTTGGDNYLDIPSCPFQIPLGALLPVRMTNLLPAAKNLGTTHITNGCHRLHPVEWNIGEAAGLLAAYCLRRSTTPHQVRADRRHLADYQRALTDRGVELAWPTVGGY